MLTMDMLAEVMPDGIKGYFYKHGDRDLSFIPDTLVERNNTSDYFIIREVSEFLAQNGRNYLSEKLFNIFWYERSKFIQRAKNSDIFSQASMIDLTKVFYSSHVDSLIEAFTEYYKIKRGD